MIDRTVGNYKIVSKLGEGGMGSVYRGVDLMLNRPVAIKVVHSEVAHQPELMERFKAEATLLAKLHHPNVASVYSFFRDGDELFLVMEFIDGQNLSSIMRSASPPDQQRSVAIVQQVLDGLQHAHGLGVLHRDIKPANILLTADGLVKITDFGIARSIGTERLTRDLRVVGTPEYLSPERVRGEAGDARSDIYSVGVLLYELLTQRLPFVRNSDFETMRAQLEEPPVPPTSVSILVAPWLEASVLRALAKKPEDRFQSAAEMRQALLSVEPLKAAASSPTKSVSAATRPRRYIAAAAILALAAIAGGAYLLGPKPQPAPAAISHPASTAPTATLSYDLVPPPPVAARARKPVEKTRSVPKVQSAKKVTSLKEVHSVYIAQMPNGLDGYLRTEISKRLGTYFTIVTQPVNADAVLKSDVSSANTINLVDSSGRVILWSGSANDKAFLNLKHGGPQEMAKKLTGQLQKVLQKNNSDNE